MARTPRSTSLIQQAQSTLSGRTKAALVAIFFMHLWEERGVARLVLVVSTRRFPSAIGGIALACGQYTLRMLGLDPVSHALMAEGDRPVNLLHRAIEHAATTARFNVFFGQGRDSYDVRGRVAHESVFNRNDGQFRCPSSQQGYSPFTTWTRGAAWIICGYAEQLEFLDTVAGTSLDPAGGRRAVTDLFLETARAACDYYIDRYSSKDGVPYWDSCALNTHRVRRPFHLRN